MYHLSPCPAIYNLQGLLFLLLFLAQKTTLGLGEVSELAQVTLLQSWCNRKTSSQLICLCKQAGQDFLWQGTSVLLQSLLESSSWIKKIPVWRRNMILFVWLISSSISDLTWECAQLEEVTRLTIFSWTLPKAQPSLQAAKLRICPLLSRNAWHSQIPSARNAALANLRPQAGDTRSALTLCSLPARPDSP